MNNCLGCLKPMKGQQPQFCPPCQKLLFDGAKISPTLSFSLTDIRHQPQPNVTATIKRISISGVQFKISLLLTDNSLAVSNERGPLEFILKPPPRSFDIKHAHAVPANEHLTMQLARQVFGLRVAANAYVMLPDEPNGAYLTRRFDILPTERLHQEDFAQIDNRSRVTHGENFKYETSHEHIASLIQRFVTAVPVALDEFFRLTLFNYLVSNSDAHLKNFSLYRLPSGEYRLTPAYDLLNTALHVDEGNGLALDLFAEEYEMESFRANAFLAYDDFLAFGQRIGLPPSRVKKLVADVVVHEAKIQQLIDRSFLPDELKARYAAVLADRRRRLRYSLAGQG